MKVLEVKNTWYTKVSTCMSTYSMNLDIEILFNRSWLKYETTKDKLENMLVSKNTNHSISSPQMCAFSVLNHQLNVCTLSMTTTGSLPYSLCSWYKN